MAKKSEKKIPTVLSFEKKIVSSDGAMYGTLWDKRDSIAVPLQLLEKTVRGTISNRLAPAISGDPLKINAKIKDANIQRVDNCALGTDQDTLKLKFTLKFLSGVEVPCSCNNTDFNDSYNRVAKNYIENEGFSELAYRYALNIANARFLWRNRVGVDNIEVRVNCGDGQFIFNALEFSIRDFETKDEKVSILAEKIANCLSGKQKFLLLEIEAYSQLGMAQDVYPSQEMVMDKGRGEKGKVLYAINGIAGMHSQKIGNAIRTIDTWYPDFSEKTGPIAIEPYGAVTNLGEAFRKKPHDFYTLFDKYAIEESAQCKEDEHYVMAVLVRGGVFGKGEKKDK